MVWISLISALVAIAGVGASWARLGNAKRRLAQELEEVRSENDSLTARVSDLERLANQNRTGVTEAKERVAKLRSTVRAEQQRLVETRQMVERIRQVQNASGAREGVDSALVLREARRMSRLGEVRRLLLLMTIHRSASTTLFDVFRGHPDVLFEPTSILWEEMGLAGRRYPIDLSNGPTAELAVEVQPGVGALIPNASGNERAPHIAIEKAHPQFFDFDVDAFGEHIERLQHQDREISLVYGIRNPLDAMWSMVEYQRRNPNWYQFLDPSAIPDFITRSIVAIEELSQILPGPIIDYSEITGSDGQFREVFMSLGEAPVSVDVFAEAVAAFAAGKRSKLQRGRFVGEERTARERNGPDGVWANQIETIDRAERAYSRLRQPQHG